MNPVSEVQQSSLGFRDVCRYVPDGVWGHDGRDFFFSFSTKALETAGNPRAAFSGVHVSYVVPDTRTGDKHFSAPHRGRGSSDFPPRPPRSPYLFRSH